MIFSAQGMIRLCLQCFVPCGGGGMVFESQAHHQCFYLIDAISDIVLVITFCTYLSNTEMRENPGSQR